MCVFPTKCPDALYRRRENRQSEWWCWRWTHCSCLLSFTQMPYNNRHKRGFKCRFCCGCCTPGVCGLCCRFWGFLLQQLLYNSDVSKLHHAVVNVHVLSDVTASSTGFAKYLILLWIVTIKLNVTIWNSVGVLIRNGAFSQKPFSHSR